jgi:cytochrome c biogenesis protein CcmG, thiol:disulfide interchange protein DsbE
MSNLIRWISANAPLAFFLLLMFFLWRGLQRDPHLLPTALLNKPTPEFRITTLQSKDEHFASYELQGKVSLLNVWATWCGYCRREHPVLMDIANKQDIPIYSLDYKDDRQQALKWLEQNGNPYKKTGFDIDGDVAIDFGVYGTPETFIIDKHGVIRYKSVGALTTELWQDKLLPLVKGLQKEE